MKKLLVESLCSRSGRCSGHMTPSVKMSTLPVDMMRKILALAYDDISQGSKLTRNWRRPHCLFFGVRLPGWQTRQRDHWKFRAKKTKKKWWLAPYILNVQEVPGMSTCAFELRPHQKIIFEIKSGMLRSAFLSWYAWCPMRQWPWMQLDVRHSLAFVAIEKKLLTFSDATPLDVIS